MADFSHLVSSKVNLGLVQELVCSELLNILEICEGPKVKEQSKYFLIAFTIIILGFDVG